MGTLQEPRERNEHPSYEAWKPDRGTPIEDMTVNMEKESACVHEREIYNV
jgi:hypothetical protein